jgi:signal transduction histidine kinase
MIAEPLLFGYLVLFGLASLACFASLPRVRRIESRDTRTGLTALLLISGTWAGSHVGYLAAPTERLQYAFYLLGLAVGLSAVGAWLYFCSAYTGRSLHRNSRIRWAALSVYLGIVSVKLTNHVHGFYFVTEPVMRPFPHLGIVHQPFHWLVMGLAYALSTVGFFMLFELFYKTDYDVRPLAGLVAITALPVGLDVAGTVSPTVLELTYSSLGVAAFAVGVAFVYLDQFRTLRIAGEGESPVVILDDDDTVREANGSARELFPELTRGAAIGEPFHTVLPEVAETVVADRPVIEREHGGETRYYRVTSNPFTAGRTEIGRVLTFADVTERERYRRELERQNERLETFASMVSHDLRNPLSVAKGHLELAREDTGNEDLETAERALDRMNDLIEDVLQLARQGQPIDATERVDLKTTAERSWEMVDAAGAALIVEDTAEIEADPDRLRQLFENLFRNAVEHGSTGRRAEPGDSVERGDVDLTVKVGTLERGGFYVEDDGPGIPEEIREEVFGSGFSTGEDGTGFGLAIVEEIVEAHGWTVRATEGREGGARFEVET